MKLFLFLVLNKMNITPESFVYQRPISLYDKELADKVYSSDGNININPWLYLNRSKITNGPGAEPISLFKQYGGALGTYRIPIIRPMDTVMVPRDIKRDTFENVKCQWPVYAGSKFQQWCSEENAIKYHAMRPIQTGNTYNNNLDKLFDTIVMRSMQTHNIKRVKPNFGQDSNTMWNALFCNESKNNIMNFIMSRVAEAVNVLPEMQKNGSWGSEQFYWTDAQIYQIVFKGQLFYKVLFNLYNPLRSTSTQVECTILVDFDGQNPMIIYIGFVSDEFWSMTGENDYKDGSVLKGYNIAPAGKNPQINIENTVNGPAPTNFGWNYENTLMTQEFNKYGFYDSYGNNVEIDASVPDSLKGKLKQFEDNSKEYLFPAGMVKPNIQGYPETVSSNYENVYQTGIEFNKNGPTNYIKNIGKVSFTAL